MGMKKLFVIMLVLCIAGISLGYSYKASPTENVEALLAQDKSESECGYDYWNSNYPVACITYYTSGSSIVLRANYRKVTEPVLYYMWIVNGQRTDTNDPYLTIPAGSYSVNLRVVLQSQHVLAYENI